VILELEAKEHEEKRKQRRQTERRNREAFRQLLAADEAKGRISYKSKWKDYIYQIKDDERFLNMV